MVLDIILKLPSNPYKHWKMCIRRQKVTAEKEEAEEGGDKVEGGSSWVWGRQQNLGRKEMKETAATGKKGEGERSCGRGKRGDTI